MSASNTRDSPLKSETRIETSSCILVTAFKNFFALRFSQILYFSLMLLCCLLEHMMHACLRIRWTLEGFFFGEIKDLQIKRILSIVNLNINCQWLLNKTENRKCQHFWSKGLTIINSEVTYLILFRDSSPLTLYFPS